MAQIAQILAIATRQQSQPQPPQPPPREVLEEPGRSIDLIALRVILEAEDSGALLATFHVRPLLVD